MKVICISNRKECPEQIKINDTYYIDPMSIYIDADGDAMGMVYRNWDMTDPAGNMLLKHFCTVSTIYDG